MPTPYDLASVSIGTRLRARLLVDTLRQHDVRCVCDCGCGVGILASLIIREGIHIIGFDIHPQLVSQAAVNNAPEGIFLIGNIEKMPFADASLENIVIGDVIEHLCNPLAAFQEIARALAPGGKAIMTIPNHNFECVCSLFRLSQADIGHQKTYSRYELEHISSVTGLQIVKHRHACNVGVAMVDAAIAKLAIIKYGKEAVQHSEMALRTLSLGLLAWFYYLASKFSYPVFHVLEYILPSVLGTENLLVLSRTSDSQRRR